MIFDLFCLAGIGAAFVLAICILAVVETTHPPGPVRPADWPKDHRSVVPFKKAYDWKDSEKSDPAA